MLWSSTSHWILGVPFDMVQRARRSGDALSNDMETLAHINVKRLLYIAQTAGSWLVGIVTFLLTMLAILGFYYGFEFAQAVLFMAAPMTIVGMLSMRTARIIADEDSRGAVLIRRITRCRMSIQVVGMFSILATSMFGMWQNLNMVSFPGL